MTHRLGTSLLCTLAVLQATACSPSVIPVGKALPLPSGAPQSQCEHERFFSLRETEVHSSASDETASGFGTSIVRTVDTKATGLGLYRYTEREPEELPEALRTLDQRLYLDHSERTEPTASKLRTKRGFVITTVVGAVVMLAGAGALIASSGSGSAGDSDEGMSAPAAIGLGAAGIGLLTLTVGTIGSLIAGPSAYERVDYDVRTRVLVPGEDDLETAGRAVDEHNQRARARCGR